MPETISAHLALFLAVILLVVSWLSILMGFVMGRKNGTNNAKASAGKTYFKKEELGEEQEGDIWQEMQEEPPPEIEPRKQTIPGEGGLR